MDDSWRDPAAAWWAKAERARTHIADVSAMVSAFNLPAAYEVRADPTGQPGRTSLSLHVLKQVPTELLTTIGDALHNMRSCLDSVAFELARRHLGGHMTDRQQKAVQFPICTDRAEFEKFLRQANQRDLYGEHERKALSCAQPFAMREEAAGLGVSFAASPQEEYRINELARLSHLNNLDKHRYLPLLAWYLEIAYFTQVVPIRSLRLSYHALLNDGDLIGYVDFDETQDDPSAAVELDVRLAFADDPGYAADFLDSLTNWHGYLTGWILPRIFIVAAGNRPPIMIGH